jgi:acyl-homoserine-lactone acylase
MTMRMAVSLVVSLALAGAAHAAADPHAARVTITRDDWGIAHVHGKTDADAVFGMIYAQAEDDFPRIEANYLTALGRRAEAEGESVIWADLRQRLYADPDQLRRDYAASPAWMKTLMNAWADGLNYYLSTHPETKPKVLDHFEPWMSLSFTEGSIGGDIERIDLKALQAFYTGGQEIARAEDNHLVEPSGSNGIAVAPARTRDGHALLLINPHTSFFFRSEQQVTSDRGLDAYGAATWGQFFIYQGFNAHAGWMHTSSGVDAVDEFAETIARKAAPTYTYGREQRPLTIKPITIRYRKADGTISERRFVTYATHHGPIVRAEGGKWIAFKMMWRPIEALQQSYLRTKAKDYAAFLKVAGLQANSSNDTLFADDRGTIAYLHPQFVPLRDDRFDYRAPVDGSDPSTDWKGLTPLAQLPKAINPKSGWVYNTNDEPWSTAGEGSIVKSAFPRYMDMAGPNPRGEHARNLLTKAGPISLPSLVDIAFDRWLPVFTHVVPRLTHAFDRLPNGDARQAVLKEPIALLRRWDERWSAESPETSLAVYWGTALYEHYLPAARAARKTPWELMYAADDAVLLATFAQGVAKLKTDFGSVRVPWGEINRFQRNDGAIVQQFADAKPSTPVPFPSAVFGTLASFGAKQYPGTKRWYGTSGNSFVAAVEFGPKVKAVAVTAGGESGLPESRHFKDQAQRYATGALRPVYFYPAELKGHVERVYHPGDVQ